MKNIPELFLTLDQQYQYDLHQVWPEKKSKTNINKTTFLKDTELVKGHASAWHIIFSDYQNGNCGDLVLTFCLTMCVKHHVKY